ncbi:carboxypeptidase-like regulatory domain-containing protein, partial [bacterium]|nr:carboxypeptidase-like regulatory domain-containing protein [bacterium]
MLTIETADHCFRATDRIYNLGKFFFETPPAGTVRLIAEQHGYQDVGEGHVELSPPFDEVVTLRLYRDSFSASGRVMCSDTKAPAPHVNVYMICKTPYQTWSAETNELGEFIFENVLPGVYTINSWDHESKRCMVSGKSPKMYQIKDKNIVNIELV